MSDLHPHHNIKLLCEYYLAVEHNVKKFEIRKNDRNFKVGQTVRLSEWSGIDFTGRYIDVIITYITDFEQKEGYIVFSFNKLNNLTDALDVEEVKNRTVDALQFKYYDDEEDMVCKVIDHLAQQGYLNAPKDPVIVGKPSNLEKAIDQHIADEKTKEALEALDTIEDFLFNSYPDEVKAIRKALGGE